MDTPLPTLTRGKIVGICTDFKTLEALVISIGGTTNRPDGSTYHCTWSLDKAVRQAVDSNTLLKEIGYHKFLHPMMIDIEPALMEST
jgi:hypothetical protein